MFLPLIKSSIKDDKAPAVYKVIGENLERHPEQRCASTDQCVEQVRGGSSVYIFVSIPIPHLCQTIQVTIN